MLTHRQIMANVHLISRSVRTLSSDDLDYVHENGRTYGNSTYHMPCIYMPDGDYAMQDLLALQHQIFVHALEGKLTTTRLLPSTRRILDLGTGPGHWAIAMARQYNAEVVGIDMVEWDLDTTGFHWPFQSDLGVRRLGCLGTTARHPRFNLNATPLQLL
jgi:2-polyprenyl-3-methyl-5-hydroxy-6-metoxy-1,4-benzoquinol methylase